MIKNLTFTEVLDTSVITACAELTKKQTRELFTAVWETPRNDELEADDRYIAGELQFNFDKETKKLLEVLVFPVYVADGNQFCGDFVDAPDYIWESFEEKARQFAFSKEA